MMTSIVGFWKMGIKNLELKYIYLMFLSKDKFTIYLNYLLCDLTTVVNIIQKYKTHKFKIPKYDWTTMNGKRKR